MKYPLTFYTDFAVPKGSAGCMRLIGVFPTIFIRPKYRDDVGIYMHELEHVKQSFKLLLWGYAFAYKFSKRYRYWSEVKAYREQAKHYVDDKIPRFATYIAFNYGLDVIVSEVEGDLRKV